MDPLLPEFAQVYFAGERPLGGWPRHFAIITAYNPDGRSVEPSVNCTADSDLRLALGALGLSHFRVIGGSRDGRHQEPGWGILLDNLRTSQELSVRFHQLAYFWVDDQRLLLVDARTGESTDQNVLWSDRWLGPAFNSPS